MSKNKLFIIFLLAAFLKIFIAQTAMAGAGWKEKQKEMFAQIPVKPGDILDRSNWEKVKDLLPEPVVKWVNDGKWLIKIGEFEYDFDYTKEWYELSDKNKGRYGLGSKKEVIDLKTKRYPMFIHGLPFPEVDVKADNDGAIKLMHNE